MDLLEVLSNLKSTSSGTGVSYYTKKCARQARLDKEFPRESGFDAQVGTVFHKLMELYYTRQLKDVVLPLDDMADFENDPVQEALRVFAAYTQFYPPEEFDVVCAEKLLPETEEQARVLADVLVDPFTFRVDLVVRLSEAQAAVQADRHGLMVEPGLYIEDHKVKKQKDSNALLKWTIGAQFTAYPLAWNALFPNMPVKGVIINTPVRHKKLGENSFYRFFVGLPGPNQTEAVVNHLRRKKLYLLTDEPNLDACDDWGICEHYMTGRCSRV